jgi:hypothetical protein
MECFRELEHSELPTKAQRTIKEMKIYKASLSDLQANTPIASIFRHRSEINRIGNHIPGAAVQPAVISAWRSVTYSREG